MVEDATRSSPAFIAYCTTAADTRAGVIALEDTARGDAVVVTCGIGMAEVIAAIEAGSMPTPSDQALSATGRPLAGVSRDTTVLGPERHPERWSSRWSGKSFSVRCRSFPTSTPRFRGFWTIGGADTLQGPALDCGPRRNKESR
jgi:hypothetical protein